MTTHLHPRLAPAATVVEQRAECYFSLCDYTTAIADWTSLRGSPAANAAAKAGWLRRVCASKEILNRPPHEVLGLSSTASEAEVRKAYRTACLSFHPDKHASSSNDARTRAKHRFERILRGVAI